MEKEKRLCQQIEPSQTFVVCIPGLEKQNGLLSPSDQGFSWDKDLRKKTGLKGRISKGDERNEQELVKWKEKKRTRMQESDTIKIKPKNTGWL